MTPHPAALSRRRWFLALAIAGVSDVVSIFAELIAPLQWGVDVATALLLFAVVGPRWQLLPALLVEAVPGLAIFPSWLIAVAVLLRRGDPSRPSPEDGPTSAP
jgi:hypothetical protein